MEPGLASSTDSNTGGMRSQRLIALSGLGVVLFTYPILSLFAHDGLVLGVPILYGYLFGAWALLIGLSAWIIEQRRGPHLPPDARRSRPGRRGQRRPTPDPPEGPR